MISVVIPLYNKSSTIAAAIDSVIAQSHEDWELIVVDDGSRDDGPAVVEQFVRQDARIRLIRKVNGGVSSARNLGVENARSAWIAFLDADDHWLPEHLANLLTLVQLVPDAPMWATAYCLVDDMGVRRRVAMRPADGQDWYRIDDYFADSVQYELPVHSSAVMVRRSALEAVGGFPVGVGSGEDVITWARLSCLGSFPFSRRATAVYMAPPISQAVRRTVIRKAVPMASDAVLAGLLSLQSRYPAHAASIGRFIGLWHRIRAMSYLESDARRLCLVDLFAAVRRSGLRFRDLIVAALCLLPFRLREHVLAWSRGFRHVFDR